MDFEIETTLSKVLDELIAIKNDRALGVLGGAVLDDYLGHSFASKWRQIKPGEPPKGTQRKDGTKDPIKDENDRTEEAFRQFIREGGGALTFGLKIELAYLTHLIGPKAHSDFVIIKEVRNKFAHMTLMDNNALSDEPVTFKTQEIAMLCNRLDIVKQMQLPGPQQLSLTIDGKMLSTTTAQDKFLAAVITYASTLLACTHDPAASVKVLLDR